MTARETGGFCLGHVFPGICIKQNNDCGNVRVTFENRGDDKREEI